MPDDGALDAVNDLDAAVRACETGDAVTPAPICRCGTSERHPSNADMCRNGHFIANNAARRIHGVRGFETRGEATLPSDVRTSADEMYADLISDLGGPEQLTALKRELAAQGKTCRVIMDLITRELVRKGVVTPRGRVRSAVTAYMGVLDRFLKVCDRLGLEREARQLPSLATYLARKDAP